MKVEHHITNGCNVKIIVEIEVHVDHDVRVAVFLNNVERLDLLSRCEQHGDRIDLEISISR